jgi:hypothetical protein
MGEGSQTQANTLPVLRVAVGEDRFGEHRGLGVSSIAFKVTPHDSSGLLILENTFHTSPDIIDLGPAIADPLQVPLVPVFPFGPCREIQELKEMSIEPVIGST